MATTFWINKSLEMLCKNGAYVYCNGQGDYIFESDTKHYKVGSFDFYVNDVSSVTFSITGNVVIIMTSEQLD